MGAVLEATDRAIEDARLVTCKKTILIEPYLALRPSYTILDFGLLIRCNVQYLSFFKIFAINLTHNVIVNYCENILIRYS